MSTKRRIVYFAICSIMYIAVIAFLFFLVGCEMLAQYGTDPNGTILIDPNQFNALINAGHAVKSIGIATGNPELVGLGILIITIGGAIVGAFLKNRKK